MQRHAAKEPRWPGAVEACRLRSSVVLSSTEKDEVQCAIMQNGWAALMLRHLSCKGLTL